jgi:hypothetical protein
MLAISKKKRRQTTVEVLLLGNQAVGGSPCLDGLGLVKYVSPSNVGDSGERSTSEIVDLSIFSTFSSVVDEATTKGLREEAIVNAVVS